MEKTINRNIYTAPAVEVIAVSAENILCGSLNPTYNPFNEEKQW